jgi:hypothetical protein
MQRPLDVPVMFCYKCSEATAGRSWQADMDRQGARTCSIEPVGKQRNGKPRFWCSTHQASATGRYGTRLEACEGAYRDVAERKIVELNPDDYPGGIALWGAVAPVYDTTGLPTEPGIHVHARSDAMDNEKRIDDTFDAVRIRYGRDLLQEHQAVITSEVAVSYYLSRFLKRDMKFLRCPKCSELHLDSGYFAVKAHRRHLCHGCGRYFSDETKAVSNPIAALHAAGVVPMGLLKPIRPDRSLDVRQADYPGGLQVWASNPALIWSADRPEEEGLHVHAYSAGECVVDDTFGRVRIDGVELDEKQVQYLMAQQALPHLANKIVSLHCPECHEPHFDLGDCAVFPHIEHDCANCGVSFSSPGQRRMVVSNPFVETRLKLSAQ